MAAMQDIGTKTHVDRLHPFVRPSVASGIATNFSPGIWLRRALTAASHKLAEKMYQDEQSKSGAQPGAAAGAKAADDNVVDAEFEEVKDK